MVIGGAASIYGVFFASIAKFNFVHITFADQLMREGLSGEQAMMVGSIAVLLGISIGEMIGGWIGEEDEVKDAYKVSLVDDLFGNGLKSQNMKAPSKAESDGWM